MQLILKLNTKFTEYLNYDSAWSGIETYQIKSLMYAQDLI